MIDIKSLRKKALSQPDAGVFVWLETSINGIPKTIVGAGRKVLTADRCERNQFIRNARQIIDSAKDDDIFVIASSYEFGTREVSTANTSSEEKTAFLVQLNEPDIFDAKETPTNLQNTGSSTNPKSRGEEDARFTVPKEQYVSKIEHIKTLANEHEIEVVCLTNEIVLKPDETNKPLDAFVKLKTSSGTDRTGFIEWKDGAILSATPERLISKAGQKVSSSPIKGTRPRGKTITEDHGLFLELAQNEKDGAELESVTSTLAEELRAVCDPQTVKVVKRKEVQTFKQVHQMASTVEGTLAHKNDLFDTIEAVFPAASMVGAPKGKASKVLNKLEPMQRGWYSGYFGVITNRGKNAELAMTIRSIEFSKTRVKIGAGGGITAGSDPEAEWEETLLKAGAMLEALK